MEEKKYTGYPQFKDLEMMIENTTAVDRIVLKWLNDYRTLEQLTTKPADEYNCGAIEKQIWVCAAIISSHLRFPPDLTTVLVPLEMAIGSTVLSIASENGYKGNAVTIALRTLIQAQALSPVILYLERLEEAIGGLEQALKRSPIKMEI